MDTHFHFYHSASGRRSVVRAWLTRLILAVAVLAIGMGVWYSLAPLSLARILGKIQGRPLTVMKLELEVEGRLLPLSPGETVEVDPRRRIRYVGFTSSRWLNYDLAAYSPDFDLGLVTGTSRSLLSVLGEDAFAEPRTVTIAIVDVKDGDSNGEGRESARASAVFSLLSAFSAEDWALMADAAADSDRRIELYRRALALDPADRSVRDRLVAVLSADEAKRGELAELLEGFLAEEPDGTEARGTLVRLLNAYRDMGDLKAEAGALERLLALEEKDGGDTAPYRRALAALYRAGEPAKAAELYEGLLKEASREERLGLVSALIDIYREAGSSVKAFEAYELLLPLVETEQAPGVWGELVRLAEELGDPLRVDRAWEGLARSLPDDARKADSWRHLGALRAAREDLAGAEAAFREASALAPDDPSLYRGLAAIARRKGDQEGLRANLEKALTLGPDPELKRELALAYAAADMRAEALAIWRELAEPHAGSGANATDAAAVESMADARVRLIDLLRPSDGELSGEFEDTLYRYSNNGVEFYNLGIEHFRKKGWDPAEKAFLKALELDPGGMGRESRAYLMAIYREKGDTRSMLVQAEALYRADPAMREHRDLMAAELEVARNWEALEKAATGWTALSPSDPDNWRYLALAQRNLKRPDADIARSLQSAARAEPKSVTSWLAAAEAMEKAGDPQAAKVAYEKVLELDETNEKAGQAILRLNLDRLSGAAGRGGVAAGGASMAPLSGVSEGAITGTGQMTSGGASGGS
ncbi:MAG: hypothetical protein LBR80_15695 [Deltaproteobacteria bacterium]|jgi:tetratricopeptide (TPR) repeat protein|nr:hypothetical protein [Deltaproteobacteria bacterium]